MTGDAHDFDSLIGDWSVRHRRLKRRLTGDTEWVEFTSPTSLWKILNGVGDVRTIDGTDECHRCFSDEGVLCQSRMKRPPRNRGDIRAMLDAASTAGRTPL
jgi:hypothetical protein